MKIIKNKDLIWFKIFLIFKNIKNIKIQFQIKIDDGQVLGWGSNGIGQIGDGTSGTNRLIPTQVSGLTSGSNVTQISAGYSHSLALNSKFKIKMKNIFYFLNQILYFENTISNKK